MKLSEKLVGKKQITKSCTAGRIHNSADRRISASAINGTGQFSIVAPWGIESIPKTETDAVVISGDSERMCIGVKQIYNYYGLKPGEIVIYSGMSTYIHLKEDGKIDIVGDVYVNGVRLGE